MGAKTVSDPIVIVGFGTAATSAVLALRAAGYEGPLTVATDGEPQPYSPVLTSYYAGGRIRREQCNAWADLDIPNLVDDLRAHVRASALDAEAHRVSFDDGRSIRYSKLLIATGAHPVTPSFPHTGSYSPHVLRTMADADRLKRALQAESCQNVLVAGSSMVALKVLEACLDRDIRTTLLGRSPHILRRSAHPAIAERFQQQLEQRGVTLRLRQTAIRCESHGADDGCIVVFDKGDAEHFDEIVLALGVEPNLCFIPDGALETDQGIIVDQFMRTSAPDVFAAGDVAQALDLSTGKARIIGLWQNAVQQGRCAARAMAAEIADHPHAQPFPGSIPSNVIHVRDILFASAGSLAEGEGRRIDLHEDDECASALVYERRGSAEHLVGFNMLAVMAPGRTTGAHDQIGRYRAAIYRSYLEDERLL